MSALTDPRLTPPLRRAAEVHAPTAFSIPTITVKCIFCPADGSRRGYERSHNPVKTSQRCLLTAKALNLKKLKQVLNVFRFAQVQLKDELKTFVGKNNDKRLPLTSVQNIVVIKEYYQNGKVHVLRKALLLEFIHVAVKV